MTIQSYKVLNGTLTLGAGPLACQAQVTAVELVPSEKVKETDPIPVLSGEELPGDSTASVTWRLKFSVFQDLRAAGLVAYSLAQSGNRVAFHLEPTDEADHLAEFDGLVDVMPIKIGGKVSKTERAQSDADWRIYGDPTPTWPAA